MRARALSFCGGMAVACVLAGSLWAQPAPNLPERWQQLDAESFASVSKDLMPRASEEIKSQLTKHAYSQFLFDEDFLASANWELLQSLLQDFGDKQVFLAGDGGEADKQMAAFQKTLSERVAKEPVAGITFGQLVDADRVLTLAGISRADLTDRAAKWMTSADWKSLDIAPEIELACLLQNEQVSSQKQMSVRWKGTITAPQSAEYRFQQVRLHRVDGSMVLRVDSEVVLDTTNADRRNHESNAEYLSRPVALGAGQAVPFEMEFRYDADRMYADNTFPGLMFPVALLTWQTTNGKPQLIPNSVFGGEAGGEVGLAAEFFSDANLATLVASREVPSPQLIASHWDVLSTEQDRKEEVVQHAIEALVSGDALAQSNDVNGLVGGKLSQLLRHCSAEQRTAILARLTSDPTLLAQLTPDSVRGVLPHLSMLPGDALADFLVAWFASRSPEPAKVAAYPGWQGDGFIGQSYDRYGWIGNFLIQGNWKVAKQLIQEGLVNDDGSCNLMAVYCLTHAANLEGKLGQLLEPMQRAIDDESLSGDAQATWLLGKAFVEEYSAGGFPRPALGLQHLEHASLLASDPALRYRIVQEQIARRGALGEIERVRELAKRAQGEFPQHTATISESVAQAEQLAKGYQKADTRSAKEVELDRLRELVRSMEQVPSPRLESTRQRLQQLENSTQ